MSTLTIVLNIVLAIGIVVAVVTPLLHAVFTQHRDHGVAAAGPPLRRRIWSAPRRSHGAPRRATAGRRDRVPSVA
jgi:hypothetical protein